MPNLHPLFVHFPVALLLLALVLEVIALLWRKSELSRAAWWNQIAGTIGLAFAVASGLYAEATVHLTAEARVLLERHEQMAFVAAALFAALLLWRIGARGKIPGHPPVLYMILFLAGVASVLTGALFGGEMVFRYGVGVR